MDRRGDSIVEYFSHLAADDDDVDSLRQDAFHTLLTVKILL